MTDWQHGVVVGAGSTTTLTPKDRAMSTSGFQRKMVRLLLTAVLISGAAFLMPLAETRAWAGAPLVIEVDRGRDCGDVEGQATYRLETADTMAEIEVHADSYWNASGLILESGKTYTFEVLGETNATWWDATHNVKPGEGWWPEGGPVLWLSEIGRFLSMLRAPKEDLLYLIGTIYGRCDDGRDCARQFPIGSRTDFKAPADGEFCAFANDLPFTYGNNSGEITIRVTRE